jgi:hypothetical protein
VHISLVLDFFGAGKNGVVGLNVSHRLDSRIYDHGGAYREA